MERPDIRTAIPRQRYQFGEFTVVVLGQVESGDEKLYQYIMAWVRDGQSDPALYVTAEKSSPRQAAEGSHQLRLITDTMSEVLDVADQWGDLEAFVERALELGRSALGLADDTPYRVM